MDLFTFFMIISLAQYFGWSHGMPSRHVVNVLDYGAIGDGKTDDSQAFMKAWNATCKAYSPVSILLLPAKKLFLLKPVKFEGPCTPKTIKVKVLGDIIAPKMSPTWDELDKQFWIAFSYVNRLNVLGNGKVDGQGGEWWKLSCIIDGMGGDCTRPKAVSFHMCNHLRLSGLTIVDTPMSHICINGCNGAILSNLTLTAPEDSPNTDGIDISASSYIQIQDSFIGTGDDCVAINGGSSYINITNIACGPGHGISVGSLGAHGSHDTVEQVYVKNCNLTGTTNGVRIKTWQGGSGYARNITFEEIGLTSVKYPIIIDQYYSLHDMDGVVKVSDITYKGIHGTSATKNAIVLNCSSNVPCTNLMLNEINIKSANPGSESSSCCTNAQGRATNTTPLVECLK